MSPLLLTFCCGAASVVACENEPVYVAIEEEEEPAPAPTCEADNCFVDDAVPSDRVDRFSEENDVLEVLAAPNWVYPLENSVLPRNLKDITLQWERGRNDEDVFRIVVTDGETERVMFVPCLHLQGMGCTYRLPEDFWADTMGALSGRRIELHMTSMSDGARSETSTLAVHVSPADVVGGLYYWSDYLWGFYRLVFGGRQAIPFIDARRSGGEDTCAGCHSVSRDGSTIAFTLGLGQGNGDVMNAAFAGRLTVADTLEPEEPSLYSPPGTPSDSGMMALNSDGTRVVTAFDGVLVLRDTTTGNELDRLTEDDIGNGERAFFPEVAPDDQSVVVTLSSDPESEIAVRNGRIAVIELANDRFGTIREVVPEDSDAFHYYPTWSPDGHWIAFVSAPSAVSESYAEPLSQLRMVSAEGGKVYVLAAASGPRGSTTTWPKFAPFEQCPDGTSGCAADERIFFITFASKRDYGLVLKNSELELPRSQLWMSAIDLNELSTGDPSYPPFWLPYQAVGNHNHLAFWTEVLRCNEDVPCGPGERCNEQGICELVLR